MSSKPKFSMGRVKVRAIRGPRKDGRWYWRAVVYEGNKERTVWTGWASQDEAEAAVAGKVAGGQLELGQARYAVRTLDELLRAWGVSVRKSALATRTKRNYYNDCRRIWARPIAQVPLTELGEAHMEDYRDDRLEEGAAPRTVKNELGRICQAWRWGQARGREHCPPWRLAPPKLKLRRVRNHHTPTRQDVLATMGAMRASCPPWAPLAYWMLWATAARIGEICSLTWADLDLNAGVVFLGRHKGAQKTGEREAPLPPPLVQALRAWQTGHPGRGVWGITRTSARSALTSTYLPRSCATAGTRLHTSHALRRAATDELCRTTTDLTAIASITGNSLDQIEKAYRKVTREDRRQAAERANLGHVPEGQVLEFPAQRPAHSGGNDE